MTMEQDVYDKEDLELLNELPEKVFHFTVKFIDIAKKRRLRISKDF